MKKTLAFIALTSMALAALLGFATPTEAVEYKSSTQPTKYVAVSFVYNGYITYTEAYQFIRDNHLDLVDPAVRRQWCDRWQPDKVSPTVFQSKQATEAAINTMMKSLGRKHDFFLSAEDSAREKTWMSLTNTVRTTWLKNGIAVIQIPSFLPKTVDQEAQLALTKCSGAKAIVLDLRGNTGGLVKPALNVAATLIQEGVVYIAKARVDDRIVETKVSLDKTRWITVTSGSNPTVTTFAKRTPLAIAATIPLAVLVDQKTASAAELLTGALKVNNRAVIIGTRTYGKGTGNKLTFLTNGRGLQATHETLLPGGMSTDGVGILPQVAIDSPANSRPDYTLDMAVTTLSKLLPQQEEAQAPASPAQPASTKKPYGGSPYVRLY